MYTIQERHEGVSDPVHFHLTDNENKLQFVSHELSGCLKYLRDQGQLFVLFTVEGCQFEWTLTDIQQISAIERSKD